MYLLVITQLCCVQTYANASTTSEEEEIVKKEREIIELLEREEINRYSSNSQEKENIGKFV